MSNSQNLLIAKGEKDCVILSNMANRHGLIAGATGTGKTVTLKVMAEAFSNIGVPVFLADIKGDLSGICEPGATSPKFEERLQKLGIKEVPFAGYPVLFWDVFGQQGHPVRTTISEMGPLLLSRLLNLNDTQTGVMNLVFKIADDNGLLLLDIKDLKSMLEYAGENASEFTTEYGTISKQTIGAIQRGVLALEQQGADQFFGEPALTVNELMKTDKQGKGYVNILASDKLFQAPALYSTFLLWLLSELFEELPEVGDLEKPKMVFFFDEAHLLFNDAPKALLDKIEQVVRLIRSKGVGVYFITQNPLDIPESVLGQLGNRVQHALRAYTPKDQKAVKAAAETFRANPSFSVEQAITELGTGEALVSFLDSEGRPSVVERAIVMPPTSLFGPLPSDKRETMIRKSEIYGKYEKTVDRESAYEKLQKKMTQEKQEQEKGHDDAPARRPTREYDDENRRYDYHGHSSRKGRPRDTMLEKMAKQAVSTVGRELIRGLLGSLLR
ncbi:MAG TPA: helicase HerA-like domain-containing protein [Bacillota bacterium]|nr:helicase HerA-like domain-containing protein [Bacillota bacterium]